LSLSAISDIEKTLLLAIALGNEFRLKAHNAQEYYYRFLPGDLNLSGKTVMKKIRKAFDSLTAKGLIMKHPTRGALTFELSHAGLTLAFGLRDFLDNNS